MLNKFLPFAQKRMGFKAVPEIRFESDETNAQNPLGKTAYYEPDNSRITVYTVGRHPKDIMRSISHELVHHAQNGRGDFANSMTMGEQGYAQNDEHLREMEREAYEQGNLCFRDWEDSIKTHHNEVLDMWQKRNNKLNESIMKKFGYGSNKLNEWDYEGLNDRYDEDTIKSAIVNWISGLPKDISGYLDSHKGDIYGAVWWRDMAEFDSAKGATELAIEIGKLLDVKPDKYGYYNADSVVMRLQSTIEKIIKKQGLDQGGVHPEEPEGGALEMTTGRKQVHDLVPELQENLDGEYDEDYRDRLDQIQADHPDKTMPEIEDMLSGGVEEPESIEPEIQPEVDPEPIPHSGGEKYQVGDTIRDEDNRTGQVLELTAYGAIAQFEDADGPEKIRFKHMTKSAGDKELARPEMGDDLGFDAGDEDLAALQEEYPQAFQVAVEEDGSACEESDPIQLTVSSADEDVTVMKQEGALVKEALPMLAAAGSAMALERLVDKYAPEINRSNFETVVRKIREFIQEAEDEGLAETEAVKYLSKRYGPIAKLINIGASSVEEAAAEGLKNIDKIKAMAGKKIEGAINFLKDLERNTRPDSRALVDPFSDDVKVADEPLQPQEARDARLHERLAKWSVK